LPEQEKKEAAESASELASDFVATLGLLDIVLGSIGLYSLRLLFGPSAAALFPSTDLSVVDVALLASAAALTGKIVKLIVATFMGGLNTIVKLKDWNGYYSRLKKALEEHCQATHRQPPDEKIGLLDLAPAYIGDDFPGAASALERVRTEAIFAYGAALFSVPYGIYIYKQGGGYTAIIFTILVCGIFFLLGIGQQLDYFKTATASLTAMASNQQRAKARHGG